MIKTNTFLLFVTIFFLFGCATDPSSISTNNSTPISSSANTSLNNIHQNSNAAILIFKKEQQLEIRKKGVAPITTSIKLDASYPIGVFKANYFEYGLELLFPNEFYKARNYNIAFEPKINIQLPELDAAFVNNTNIFVFPNDTRKGQPMVADFSSPHWMAELYAKMNLTLREFD